MFSAYSLLCKHQHVVPVWSMTHGVPTVAVAGYFQEDFAISLQITKELTSFSASFSKFSLKLWEITGSWFDWNMWDHVTTFNSHSPTSQLIIGTVKAILWFTKSHKSTSSHTSRQSGALGQLQVTQAGSLRSQVSSRCTWKIIQCWGLECKCRISQHLHARYINGQLQVMTWKQVLTWKG